MDKKWMCFLTVVFLFSNAQSSALYKGRWTGYKYTPLSVVYKRESGLGESLTVRETDTLFSERAEEPEPTPSLDCDPDGEAQKKACDELQRRENILEVVCDILEEKKMELKNLKKLRKQVCGRIETLEGSPSDAENVERAVKSKALGRLQGMSWLVMDGEDDEARRETVRQLPSTLEILKAVKEDMGRKIEKLEAQIPVLEEMKGEAKTAVGEAKKKKKEALDECLKE